LPGDAATTAVYLLIGTERGFCGDFNHALVRHLEATVATRPSDEPVLIVVGHKLHTLFEDDVRVTARVEGANVVDEVSVVLDRIVSALSTLQERQGMLALYGLYHGGDNDIVTRKLLPPFERHRHGPRRHAHPPVLNLSPADFLMELTEHYLFAALHAMLYASLAAENHNRVTHLEGAIHYLDDASSDLARKCSALRQEEIIEEIEVILLSAGGLQQGV
jgi:F-type H+-transporting ATPase subunit gamma